jgi:hypothetical protein
MPQKLFMQISTNTVQDQMKYLEAYQKTQKINAQNAAKHTTLKTPMIGRIHDIRPGCGSCGK